MSLIFMFSYKMYLFFYKFLSAEMKIHLNIAYLNKETASLSLPAKMQSSFS